MIGDVASKFAQKCQAMTEKLFETLKGSAQSLKSTHLRELLKDEARQDIGHEATAVMVQLGGICLKDA